MLIMLMAWCWLAPIAYSAPVAQIPLVPPGGGGQMVQMQIALEF